MTGDKIQPRLLWALERLGIAPSDVLLEIGCGNGHLVSLAAGKLQTGRILGIDRSARSISMAAKNNATAIATGRVEIRNIEFAALQPNGITFDKIFAFNVNVFWLKPSRELAMARQLLKQDGGIHLFFDPPSPAQASPIAAKLHANLTTHGFQVSGSQTADIQGRLCMHVSAVLSGAAGNSCRQA